MSELSIVALLLGLFALTVGGLSLLIPARIRAGLAAFPRSIWPGRILAGLARANGFGTDVRVISVNNLRSIATAGGAAP